MTWMYVDDRFPEHPKLVALETTPRTWADCVALWLTAGCYAKRNETDGHVPLERLWRLTPLSRASVKAAAEKLVDLRLWERCDDGFRFHDWPDYQMTKAEIEVHRRQKTNRQRRWRAKVGDDPVDGDVDASTDGRVDALVDGDVDASTDAPVDRLAPAPARAGARVLRSAPLRSADPEERVAGGGVQTPTSALWALEDRRWICAARIWSAVCERADRPWTDQQAGGRDRDALSRIAAYAAVAKPVAPGDVALGVLEAFSSDESQEPYGHDLTWCADHVAVYAAGQTPPRKGERPQASTRGRRAAAPMSPELAALDDRIQSLLEQIDAAQTAGDMMLAANLRAEWDKAADARRLAARSKRGAA